MLRILLRKHGHDAIRSGMSHQLPRSGPAPASVQLLISDKLNLGAPSTGCFRDWTQADDRTIHLDVESECSCPHALDHDRLESSQVVLVKERQRTKSCIWARFGLWETAICDPSCGASTFQAGGEREGAHRVRHLDRGWPVSPITLLPGWIRWTSEVQPFTPATDLLRHLLVDTPLVHPAGVEFLKLVGFSVLLLPAGFALLRAAIRYGQRTGTIAEYRNSSRNTPIHPFMASTSTNEILAAQIDARQG
jgi:hypothetical protein